MMNKKPTKKVNRHAVTLMIKCMNKLYDLAMAFGRETVLRGTPFNQPFPN